jgi:DNA-binding MarR family transcriptional regulator
MSGPLATSLEIATRLHRSTTALGRRLRATRRDRDLTPSKLLVLGLLRRDGGTLPKDIASRLGVKPQSLTRPLADLDRLGYIERSVDAADGRRTPLTLTRTGDAALTRDLRLRRERLARAIDTLSPEAQELLATASTVLDHLIDIIEPE